MWNCDPVRPYEVDTTILIQIAHILILAHRSTTHRPVQVPVGALVTFTMQLLSSTAEEQVRITHATTYLLQLTLW